MLDLGGDDRADYRKLIGGTHTFTTVNMDEKARPDILHDLEKPLPVGDASYDHVVLMNVLEHIYNFRQLLSEAARVTKPGGKIIIVVPFLFPLPPSPNDYWRFTAQTLRKECEGLSLTVEKLETLGTGVSSAQYVMIDRLMPGPVRFIAFYVCRPLAYSFDALFTATARVLGKKYHPSDYALGYCLVGRKEILE